MAADILSMKILNMYNRTVKMDRLKMSIAIDISALIAVIANEQQKQKLVDTTKGADLIAPHSVHWEIGNAFSALFNRRKADLNQTLAAIAAYQQIPIRFVEVDLVPALNLSLSLNIDAYEAYIIACALKYNCPLLSLDHQLLAVAEKAGAKIIKV